mmetsp:Transcript_23779/g.26387  ORF Transcript_23779/g.26387 Transcript_23779/m.26387 type:complete len:201 (-) Transcript_23779:166-768(-)
METHTTGIIDQIPTEIWAVILNFIPGVYLPYMRVVCSVFSCIVKDYLGYTPKIVITIENKKQLKDYHQQQFPFHLNTCQVDIYYEMTGYDFKTYIQQAFSVHSIYKNVNESFIKALAGVHTINLTYTQVTNKGIKALAGVHTICLSSTRVTDKGIEALVGVHTINLFYTEVTDKGIKALTGVHKIYLTEKDNNHWLEIMK